MKTTEWVESEKRIAQKERDIEKAEQAMNDMVKTQTRQRYAKKNPQYLRL